MTFQRNSRDGVLYPGWPCGIEADYLDLPHVPGADSCNLKKLVKSKASYCMPFHRDNEGQGFSGKPLYQPSTAWHSTSTARL